MTKWTTTPSGGAVAEHSTNLNRTLSVAVPENGYGAYLRLRPSDTDRNDTGSDVSAFLSPNNLDALIVMLIEAKMRGKSSS